MTSNDRGRKKGGKVEGAHTGGLVTGECRKKSYGGPNPKRERLYKVPNTRGEFGVR